MEDCSTSFVPSLQRGIRILEILAKSRAGLSLSQITRQLALPKSSVHCLLRTFEDAGYVYRDASCGKYRISLAICDLARQAVQSTSLRDYAKLSLRRLAELTGLTVHMAVLEQGSCILIEKVTPLGVPRTATWLGKQLALHCTAVGKVLLAYLPETDAERLILHQGFIRYNDNTICSLRKLRQELESVRLRGYSLDDEEEEIGVRCLGAPVLNGAGQAIAAVSIVGDTVHISEETLPHLKERLTGAANRIRESLRHAQPDGGNPGQDRPVHYDIRGSFDVPHLRMSTIESVVGSSDRCPE